MKTIVLAWVTNTGFRLTGHRVGIYGEKAEMATGLPEASAAIWKNAGTAEDVKKAQKHLDTQNISSFPIVKKRVIVYETSEKDPLGRAKREILPTKVLV